MKIFSKMRVSMYVFFTLLLMAVFACGGSPSVTQSSSIVPSSNPSQPPNSVESPVSTPSAAQPSTLANRVDIAIFHPKVRCASCISIEQRTRALLDDSFKDEMAKGKLTIQSYDFQEKQNADLVKKYKPVGSQLFMTTVKTGVETITQIDDVWMPQLLNSGPAFDEFLHKTISQKLKEVS
jgi:hypothetical protein